MGKIYFLKNKKENDTYTQTSVVNISSWRFFPIIIIIIIIVVVFISWFLGAIQWPLHIFNTFFFVLSCH